MSDDTTAEVLVYYSPYCPYCMMAKRLLDAKKVNFEAINVQKHPEKRDEMLSISNGQHTVPQIFINQQHIGGYTDMAALEQEGKLDQLLGSK